MKLYDQILLAAITFLSLDANATESEVHQALIEKEPLSKMLADASEGNAKIEELGKKVEELTTQVNSLTENQELLSKENAEKISQLETDLKSANDAASKAVSDYETEKAKNASEVKALNGKIAELKVGKNIDGNVTDPEHPGGNGGGVNEKKVISVKDTGLTALLKKEAFRI